MRILQVNKFLYKKGGAESYMLELSQALLKAGHEVAFFGMDHPNNPDLPYKQYWVKGIDFKNIKGISKLKAAPRFIWNRQAQRNFKKIIKDFRPDIIHCHNIYHQLSPSILPIAKAAGIPVVMHLHDYKLVSADYLMFHGGQACTKCVNSGFWHCVKNRCYGSYSASLLASIETLINRDILNVYRKNIDRYISPSRFVKQMFIGAGYPGEKIEVIPNFIMPEEMVPKEGESDYLLYFGRLSPEKGVDMLIRSIAETDYKLKIAGAGPQEQELKDLAKSLNLDKQVEFTGFQNKENLDAMISKCRAAIFPSICFENAPLSLLEALGRGKICLASNIGGIPEIIEHGDNGLLFSPNMKSLREAIDSIGNIDIDWMKNEAFRSSKRYYSDKIFPKIIRIYQESISSGKQKNGL